MLWLRHDARAMAVLRVHAVCGIGYPDGITLLGSLGCPLEAVMVDEAGAALAEMTRRAVPPLPQLLLPAAASSSSAASPSPPPPAGGGDGAGADSGGGRAREDDGGGGAGAAAAAIESLLNWGVPSEESSEPSAKSGEKRRDDQAVRLPSLPAVRLPSLPAAGGEGDSGDGAGGGSGEAAATRRGKHRAPR